MLTPLRGARAQDPEALARVRDLNKKAVDSYENLDLDEARKSLMTALEICATEGLNRHALKATTHLNLAVVLVGGLKQRDGATKQFKRALEIDPNIKVPKRLINPEIQAAFDDAVREMAGGPPAVAGTPPGSGPATTPPLPDIGGAPRPAGTVIVHNPVTDARPNEDLPIKATVDASLRFDRVVLAYRPEGASDFLARDMEAETGGEFVARIPEPATHGGTVAYYIEARGRGGQALARNGSPDEPHVITLGGAGSSDTVAQVDSGEIPDQLAGAAPAGPGRYWFSLGIGAGGGYVKGSPEVNPHYLDQATRQPQDIRFNSMAAAKLLHFTPEIGYFYTPRLLLGLQGRLQYTSGATEVIHESCAPVCKPATGAIAVLGKATYLFNEQAAFRPFVSLLAGGGYIRYLVDLGTFLNECGPNKDQGCIDTVAGGGLLVGPSVGFMYGLTGSLFATGTGTALLGVPKTAFNFDLNLGIGYKL